jgi:hypothetical protein
METIIKQPILITGCPRSGTSLVAGIINLCGAWGGQMVGPTENNRKGFFENTSIREFIKSLLKSIGCDQFGQCRFPKTEFINQRINGESFRESVLNLLQSQGLTGQQWFVKGIKIAHLWPVWAAAFPETKYVVVRRVSHEIAASCMRTSFMNSHSTEAGWIWMINQYLAKFGEMWAAGLPMLEVWPKKIINGDYAEIISVINWLGLEWNEAAVEDFVEPRYWNGGRNGE